MCRTGLDLGRQDDDDGLTGDLSMHPFSVHLYFTATAISHVACCNYPVRLRTRGRVITLSVHPWICLSVCFFVYTKMSTVSEVGKHAMCTYHVRGRN